jgi:hypothetical protein
VKVQTPAKWLASAGARTAAARRRSGKSPLVRPAAQFLFDSRAASSQGPRMAKSGDGGHVEVQVFLYGIQPKIWRRFSISAAVTFAALHDAIQAAMGWENKRPHEFRHGKSKRLVDVIGPVGLEEMVIGEFQDEAQVTVADFIGKKRLPIRMLYRYDFADDWIHELVFEKKVGGEGGPVMLGGERNCPPEDYGGAFAYMQSLHGDTEWMDRKYDPEAFDMAAVSFDQRKSKRRR